MFTTKETKLKFKDHNFNTQGSYKLILVDDNDTQLTNQEVIVSLPNRIKISTNNVDFDIIDKDELIGYEQIFLLCATLSAELNNYKYLISDLNIYSLFDFNNDGVIDYLDENILVNFIENGTISDTFKNKTIT